MILEILLYCDTLTIIHYTMTCKNRIYPLLWLHKKYAHHELPMLTTPSIKEYDKTFKMKLKAEKLYQLFMIEKVDTSDATIRFRKDKYVHLLPTNLRMAIEHDAYHKGDQYITIYYKNVLKIGYFSDYQDYLYEEIVETNQEEIVMFLLKIMYYFPKKQIRDDNEIDFILDHPYHPHAWPKHKTMVTFRYHYWNK